MHLSMIFMASIDVRDQLGILDHFFLVLLANMADQLRQGIEQLFQVGSSEIQLGRGVANAP